MKKDTEPLSPNQGADDFLAASDKYFAYVAKYIEGQMENDEASIETIREICEIIKITTASIKVSSEGKKSNLTPAQKLKQKKNGDQAVV